MTSRSARPIYDLKNGGHNVPRKYPEGQIRTPWCTEAGINDLPQDRKTRTMNTMNASLMMDKVGALLINAALLAALPTALVAILLQAF